MNGNNDLIFIDTNIPMYAAGKDHPLRAACQIIMSRIAEGKIRAVTDAEVHQEILHRYISLRLARQACRLSSYFQEIVPLILPVTIADVSRARQLSEQHPHLNARDLIHAAIMLNHGISRIVSADTHFDRIDRIIRFPPEQAARVTNTT